MASFEFYQQRANQFQSETEKVEGTIRSYAWSRLCIMLVALALIYFGFSNHVLFYFSAALFVVFFFLVKKQLKLEEQKRILQNLAKLNEIESKVTQFDYAELPDGIRFANPHHPFGYDLDLFGQGSLFQYLNRSATQLGEERFASELSQLPFTKEEILLRQEAIRDLGSKIDFRQHAWAVGKEINDKQFDKRGLEEWLKEEPFIYKRNLYTILKWFLPAMAIGAIILTITDSKYYPLVLLMMIIQTAVAGFHSKRISAILRVLENGKAIMANYSKLFELIHREQFSSTLMKQHHAFAETAGVEVKKFSKLVNALESRMNPIAMMFGNGLFLYDFHSISNLEEWREKNALHLPLWLKSLSEWDALLSLANLHYNYPEYAFAEITGDLVIEGKAIAHPLINSSYRIANNASLGKPQHIMLITGANMAGKSTFLRTIGVNFILAQIGSPVCALQWKSPIIELRSGMRTSDSLQDHQSYFFAELNRLQSITNELKSGKRMLILLDEILKGTNSTDKQLGSRELLKQLKDYNVLCLLATHDIALGDLQEQYPQSIVNTCFEGKIEDGQLSFDYTLHYGVAEKANATFLMRQMGIIPS